MALIQQRTGSIELLSQLALSGSDQIGYTLPMGNAWQTLKIAFSFTIPKIGGEVNFATTVNPTWFVGMCSGTTNMVKSATCTNFVGWRLSAGNMLYAAGFATPTLDAWIQNGGNTFNSCTKIGSTVRDVASPNQQMSAPANGTVNWFWMGQITKGTPNYTMKQTLSVYNNWYDIPTNGLRAYAEEGNIDTQPGAAFSWATTSQLATEASGSLDTFNLYWNEPAGYKLELGGVVVRRME